MKFLRQFLAILASIVLVYLGIVVVVNPRGEFPSRRFPWVLPNSRRVKVELYSAARRSGPIDGLILGSSRSMKLPAGFVSTLTGSRFFNFAVFSGTIEDDLAILRWTIQNGSAPADVILGLEENSLQPGPPNPELLSNLELSTAFNAAARNLFSDVVHWVRLARGTITPAYAANTVQSIHLHFSPELPIQAIEPDGSIRYFRKEKQIADGTYNTAAVIAPDVAASKTHAPLARPDSARVARLAEVLRIADSVGAHVTVWMTPLHPSVIAVLSKNQRYVASVAVVRATVAAAARRYNARFVDLMDLGDLAGPSDIWYDSEHYGDEVAARIATALATARGATGAR